MTQTPGFLVVLISGHDRLVSEPVTSVIQIMASLFFNECTEQIEVDYHFICKAFDQNIITSPHIPSNL